MNQKKLIRVVALAAALLTGNQQNLIAQSPKSFKDGSRSQVATTKKTEFLRLVNDQSGTPQSLETSITRYRNDDGNLLIDLIAVIHVGEQKYYRRLSHQFTQYDSLLYELVAPAGSQVPNRQTSESNGNPIRWLQQSMQNMLGLHSQLEHIDYTKANFVHADLSPRAIQQKMSERGDTPWSVGLKAITEIMNQQKQSQKNGTAGFGDGLSDFDDLFDAVSNPGKLKTMLATQFAASGVIESGLGETLNQLLITDRNQAVIKVLQQQLADGKTRIGIFYGAAHMPDFENRLVNEFGMRKTEQAWVQAWDLKTAPDPTSGATTLTDMFFQLFNDLDESPSP